MRHFSVQEAQAKQLERLPITLLEQIKTGKQAMALSVSMPGATHESLASDLKTTQYSISRIQEEINFLKGGM